MTGDSSTAWRLAKAQRFLDAAGRAAEAGDPETAVSRAYYAAYHSVIAVLEERERIRRPRWSHNFQPFIDRYNYLEEFSESLALLYRLRTIADYEDQEMTEVQALMCVQSATLIRQRLAEVIGDA